MSCRGCIAVSSLPKSQFLIASNSSEPPSTTFSHPGVSEEKEEKSFLFHQKPCLRLFWSRLDDWLSLFCFGSHFSQLTSSPAQQQARQAREAVSHYNLGTPRTKWQPSYFGARLISQGFAMCTREALPPITMCTRDCDHPLSHSVSLAVTVRSSRGILTKPRGEEP